MNYSKNTNTTSPQYGLAPPFLLIACTLTPISHTYSRTPYLIVEASNSVPRCCKWSYLLLEKKDGVPCLKDVCTLVKFTRTYASSTKHKHQSFIVVEIKKFIQCHSYCRSASSLSTFLNLSSCRLEASQLEWTLKFKEMWLINIY